MVIITTAITITTMSALPQYVPVPLSEDPDERVSPAAGVHDGLDLLPPPSPRSSSRKQALLKRFGLLLHRVLLFLLPSFTQRYFAPQKEPAVEKRRPTDYLDGVRGVASLVVFIFHWSAAAHPEVNSGYGQGDNWSVLQLPFIRIFFSGAAMVAIFFVVSGYVLSQRCIVLIRQQSHGDLMKALASLTFRRAMRLFLPSIVSSFLAYLCQRAGMLPLPKKGYEPGFVNDTSMYFSFLSNTLLNVWTWNIDFKGWYNPHLWTIPVEFRCSMVLFLVVLGLSRCRTPIRVLVECGILLNCFLYSRWDVALFMAGMLLAEATEHYAPQKMQQPHPPVDELDEKPRNKSSFRSKVVTCILVLNLIIGVYLAGYPRDNASKTPGYAFLSTLWPRSKSYKRRVWHAYAAMLIVSSITFLPRCQRPFTTRFARYLGKISYALYLVHGITNRTFGKAMRNSIWRITGKEGWWRFNGGWLLTTVLYVPIVFCVADIFWRAVDMTAVRFARGIENRCGVKTARVEDR